jgi:predicted small secreted protein
MTTQTKTLLGSLLLISLFALSGCNTVKGIGEDFEAMGESMQKAGE